LGAESADAVAHVREARVGGAIRAAPRPRHEKFAVGRPHPHFVRTREVDESLNVASRRGNVSPDHLENRDMKVRIADGRDVL
jgi:hypothetical protein